MADEQTKTFLSLPSELRNRIYELVFTPEPIVDLRKHCKKYIRPDAHERTNCKECASPLTSDGSNCQQTIIHHHRRMSKYKPKPGHRHQHSSCRDTSWSTSLSGIILVSHQVSKEAIGIMYASCIFCFRSHYMLRGFVQTADPANLRQVRSVRFEHDLYPDEVSYDAEVGPQAVICRRLVEAMPGITKLEVRVKQSWYLNDIVPHSGRGADVTLAMARSSLWYELADVFSGLDRLQSVRFRLQDAGKKEDPTKSYAYGDVNCRDPHVRRTWIHWAEMLSDSVHEEVEWKVLRTDEQTAWDRHLRLLKAYEAWKERPFAPIKDFVRVQHVGE